MLKELTTINLFFKDPLQTYSARQIAKSANISHITAAKKLNELEFIERAKFGPYVGYKAKITQEFTRLRFLYNYQKIHETTLLQTLISFYSHHTIVLFGSFAQAVQTPSSDIDILIVSEKKSQIDCSKFEKELGHKIQLFVKTKEEIKQMKKTNPNLLNSMCNGIVLNGELEGFLMTFGDLVNQGIIRNIQ